MSLLSHGAEPSRRETHHILIAAWKELCWKGFSPMSLSLSRGGWMSGFSGLEFISEELVEEHYHRMEPVQAFGRGQEKRLRARLCSYLLCYKEREMLASVLLLFVFAPLSN